MEVVMGKGLGGKGRVMGKRGGDGKGWVGEG